MATLPHLVHRHLEVIVEYLLQLPAVGAAFVFGDPGQLLLGGRGGAEPGLEKHVCGGWAAPVAVLLLDVTGWQLPYRLPTSGGQVSCVHRLPPSR